MSSGMDKHTNICLHKYAKYAKILAYTCFSGTYIR